MLRTHLFHSRNLLHFMLLETFRSCWESSMSNLELESQNLEVPQ